MNLTKFKFLFVAASLTIISAFFSCGKDGIDNTGNSSFTASVDGNSWVADKQVSAYNISTDFNVTGVANDNSAITITIREQVTGEKTYDASYDVNVPNPIAAIAYAPNSTEPAYVGFYDNKCSGQVKITKLDVANKLVSGTFNMYGGRYFQFLDFYTNVTNGKFENIKYETEITSTNTNTFTAKVDGTPLTIKSVNGFASGSILQVGGSSAQNFPAIGLVLPTNVSPGTYDLTGVGGTYSAIYNESSSKSFISTTGKVTISSHNVASKTIKGTFYFEAKEFLTTDKRTISEGTFEVKYN